MLNWLLLRRRLLLIGLPLVLHPAVVNGLRLRGRRRLCEFAGTATGQDEYSDENDLAHAWRKIINRASAKHPKNNGASVFGIRIHVIARDVGGEEAVTKKRRTRERAVLLDDVIAHGNRRTTRGGRD